MAISPTQLSLVLSGGSGNNDPTLSLGGAPSAIPITPDQFDNLFDDVSPDEATTGLTDYRCMYIFNDGMSTLYDCQVWIGSQIEGGADVSLGVSLTDEVQRITIRGDVTAGSMTLSFKGNRFTSSFDTNVSTWAQNIALLMNGILDSTGQPILTGVQSSGQISGSTRYIDITFAGADGARDQELIVAVSNNLTPVATIEVSGIVQGGPVNTIAARLDVDTTPPTGVTFLQPSPSAPISIVKLASGEGFPLWAQRTTPPGAAALSQDGFNMQVLFQSLPLN